LSILFEDATYWIAQRVFRAIQGNKRLRLLFILAASTLLLAIVLVLAGQLFANAKPFLTVVAATLGVLGGLLILGIAGYQTAIEETEREKTIKRVEERAREHPEQPQAAWELATIKLESYLSRNLSQVRWIFFLTLIVMLAGFVIIGYGVMRVYQSPDNFKPSIVVTISGVVVEFISATFLLIYKSTMEQAKDYVNILERINAVGMSVQILDNIESEDSELRDKTHAEVALGLLSLYGALKTK
jgi:arginine exporter protein ArgO